MVKSYYTSFWWPPHVERSTTNSCYFVSKNSISEDVSRFTHGLATTKFRTLIGDPKLRLILLFGQLAAMPGFGSEVNIIIRSVF